ncbi:5'-nucleotidase [Bacteroides sedimenti]|uniref:5'-nucleotidase n=1 Tax=Bacteroides sedimenti TaxID=2136147 RepID=A0ABM8IJ74_9BACE
MNKYRSNKVLTTLCLTGLFLFPACHSVYKLTSVEGRRIEINSIYDKSPDQEAAEILTPYKAKVDSIMSPVIGFSEMDMSIGRPESLLSNLVADALWSYSNSLPEQKVDFAVINMGGLRSSLPKGEIAFGTIFKILPFENSLCLLSMKGKDVRFLFKDIARVGGQGVSHIKLLLSKPVQAEVLEATIDGEPINDEKSYWVATLDYLAEGNDGLSSFLKAEKRVCPEGATIRQIFLDYVKAKTVRGEKVTSRLDGRIEIMK